MHKLLSGWLVLHTLSLMIKIPVLKITVIVKISELAKHYTPPLKGLRSDEKGKFVILASLDLLLLVQSQKNEQRSNLGAQRNMWFLSTTISDRPLMACSYHL